MSSTTNKEKLKQEMSELDAWIKMVRIDSLLSKMCLSIVRGVGAETLFSHQQTAAWKQFLSQHEDDLIHALALFEKAGEIAVQPVYKQS